MFDWSTYIIVYDWTVRNQWKVYPWWLLLFISVQQNMSNKHPKLVVLLPILLRLNICGIFFIRLFISCIGSRHVAICLHSEALFCSFIITLWCSTSNEYVSSLLIGRLNVDLWYDPTLYVVRYDLITG